MSPDSRAGHGDDPRLDHYRDMIRRWVQRAGTPLSDASDAVQETFLKACRHLDRLGSLNEPGRRAWLKRAAQRTAIDRYKYEHRSKRDVDRLEYLVDLNVATGRGRATRDEGPGPDLPSGHSSPVERAERREELQQREDALRRLPETHRIAVELYQGGWKIKAIARRLGLQDHKVAALLTEAAMLIGASR